MTRLPIVPGLTWALKNGLRLSPEFAWMRACFSLNTASQQWQSFRRSGAAEKRARRVWNFPAASFRDRRLPSTRGDSGGRPARRSKKSSVLRSPHEPSLEPLRHEAGGCGDPERPPVTTSIVAKARHPPKCWSSNPAVPVRFTTREERFSCYGYTPRPPARTPGAPSRNTSGRVIFPHRPPAVS
jgi:hypothetical protein